ncbi:YncE family protein [Microvirga sp. M2]|uniref:YncE family protein n=1 Tax=Microvirga sp. M2 TaxID=3073270 RepID=UPI0039C2C470
MLSPLPIIATILAGLSAGPVLAPLPAQSDLSNLIGAELWVTAGQEIAGETGAKIVLASQPSAHEHGGHAPTSRIDPEAHDAAKSAASVERMTLSFDLISDDRSSVTAGRPARAVLRITDAKTGQPITGQSVAGWMLLRRNAQVAAEMSCKAKAQLFTQGRVTARPDVDLNASRLLVLDRSGSIAVIDPQVNFTITQMQSVIPLPGAPGDWGLSADSQMLFVSIPIYGAVAVVDLRSFQVVNLLEFGKGTLPTSIMPLPDGRFAVYLSATNSVAIAGPQDAEPPTPIPVGSGPVALSIREGRHLHVATSDKSLSVIDLADRSLKAQTSLEPGEHVLTYSRSANNLYAAKVGSGAIEVFEPGSLQRHGRIETGGHIFSLAATPDGSHLVVLDREANEMVLIEAGSGALVDRKPVARQPVEIMFSHDYAYIRGLSGDHFTVVELAELTRGRIVPLNVQSASRSMTGQEATARARLVTSYGHGALIANPAEKVAYYYMEGMNTPMGTVPTYSPTVQGVLTLERGFRETEPGVYETTAVLPFGGTYDVPVMIDTPDAVTCFTAEAKPAEPGAKPGFSPNLRLEIVGTPSARALERGKVVVRIIDAQTNQPVSNLQDVRLLAFSSTGSWQARKWAADLGDGRYETEWIFPRPGRYGISTEVASRRLKAADQPPIYLKVAPSEPPNVTDTQGEAP